MIADVCMRGEAAVSIVNECQAERVRAPAISTSTFLVHAPDMAAFNDVVSTRPAVQQGRRRIAQAHMCRRGTSST